MADNVTTTATSPAGLPDATVIATKDIGAGVQANKIVLVNGSGTETPLPPLGQALAAASLPVILPSATITTLTPPAAITGFATEATIAAEAVLVGAVTESAPGTDTASSGLNGRLQRVAQRLTSLIALFTNGVGTATAAVRTVAATEAITGQGSQTAINQNIVNASAGSTGSDFLGFRSIALQIVPASGTFTAGVISFEGSNDNTTWGLVFLQDMVGAPAVSVSSYTIAATTNRYFAGPLQFRYFRARISTGITGTTTGVQCYTVVSQASFVSVGQQVLLGAGSASVGTVVLSANTPVLAAGTNAAGDFGVQYRANATGAGTVLLVLSAASTNATSAKASAGRVVGYQLTNTTASAKFFKLYNKASAPTVGTDTPVATIGIPPNGTVSLAPAGGLGFATGIAFAITGASATSDTTAVAVGDVTGFLAYA